MARVPSLPTSLTTGTDGTSAGWRHSAGGLTLRVLRFPGSLVTSRLKAKTGESRFGLGEDRMIIRTLINMVVWSVVIVFLAWMWVALV